MVRPTMSHSEGASRTAVQHGQWRAAASHPRNPGQLGSGLVLHKAPSLPFGRLDQSGERRSLQYARHDVGLRLQTPGEPEDSRRLS